MKKILVFTTRQLCYNSAHYFALKLMEGFEKCGFECEHCEIPEYAIPSSQGEFAESVSVTANMNIDYDAESVLEKYIGKEYLAIIDFNSKLPRLVMDDDSYYLDNIDAPFYNFILDHPLYHHSTLSCKLKNYNVFSVDKGHCQYIRDNYPNIRSVNQVELGATEVSYNGEVDKCVLFTGTYRDPGKYLEKINCDEPHRVAAMNGMISIMKEYEEISISEAFEMVGRLGDAELLNSFYLVEAYYRNYHRKYVIDQLVEAGIPVKVVGDWWNNYPYISRRNIKWESPVTFAESYRKIRGCRLLLDSSPFFREGVHDRIYAGMANKTAVLTDFSQYRQEHFDKYVGFYRLGDVVDQVKHLLEDDEAYKEMVEKAFERYRTDYTWEKCTRRIIKYFLCE